MPTPPSLRDCVGIRIGIEGIRLPYIDDFNTVFTCLKTINHFTRRVASRLICHELPVADDNTIWCDGRTLVVSYGLKKGAREG